MVSQLIFYGSFPQGKAVGSHILNNGFLEVAVIFDFLLDDALCAMLRVFGSSSLYFAFMRTVFF